MGSNHVSRKTFLIMLHGICLLGFAFSGCEDDKVIPVVPKAVSADCGDLSNVSFSMQVQPLINAHCVMCHDASTGIQLQDYAHVVLFANSGQLKGVITGDPNYTAMPPQGPLDSCTIRTIVKWVEEGALNN